MPLPRSSSRWPSCGLATAGASAEESEIRVGAIDAVLTTPPDVERPPVALLIAGSGSTDHDGNGPQIKPATLKKLSEQLAARKIATLRYDKRGAGGWKPEFGRPEDFRFKDYVDDAAALVGYLRNSGKFSRIVLVGHSEGGLVAILTARRVPVDRLVLLATAARRQGDLLKAQLEKKLAPDVFKPIAQGDRRPSWPGQIVDPPPPGLSNPAGDAARHRLGIHGRSDRSPETDRAADDDRRRRPRPAGGAAGLRWRLRRRRRRRRRSGFPT